MCKMVSGANNLLNQLENRTNKTFINFNTKYENNKLCINLIKTSSTLFGGAYYKVEYGDLVDIDFPKEIWLCPVTLLLLKHYPKNISINIAKQY